MSTYPVEMIKEVRNRSHASLTACADALKESDGDVEKALKVLQEKGVINGASKARVATEGRVEAYVHQDARISVLVEINCETDFSARSEFFKGFCEMVSMHIAAMSPKWVKREDVPEDVIAEQRGIFEIQLKAEKKPEKVWPAIMNGKMERWYSEVCLLEQKAVASDTPDATIEKVRALLSSKIGESVSIRRFARWEVGEGLQKVIKGDYASEIAGMAGMGHSALPGDESPKG